MDEYLIFANGETCAGKARQNGEYLFVYLRGVDMNEAIRLLSKGADSITYHYYKAELVFEGFTALKVIQHLGDRISAMLERGTTDAEHH